MKVSVTVARAMAEAEEQASDIRFPPSTEHQLRYAAAQSRTEQELAVAAATKNKPPAYVLAAWKLIHESGKSCHAEKQRYRRKSDWTLREQQVALALAASGKTLAQIATTLGRTHNAVRLKLRRCGLPHAQGSRDPDLLTASQLAKKLHVHRAVIRQWEDSGLSSRDKVKYTSLGAARLRRTGFIEHQCVESFFKTLDGIAAASRLDNVSLQQLTVLLGFDPCQMHYEESVEAAKRRSTQDTERKQKARIAAATQAPASSTHSIADVMEC